MKPPPVRFAESPDGRIAYQVIGDGPIDLVLALPQWPNLDAAWEQPALEQYFRRIASFCRLIYSNPRGTGLSDPIPLGAPPSQEEWATDYRWILDSAGSERAAFLAHEGPAWSVMFFAATFPERLRNLVLVNSYATLGRHDDYPWGFPDATLAKFADAYVALWGTEESARVAAPELADDERFRESFARLERLSMSSATVRVVGEALKTVDVRGILPNIKAPTLVISHADHPYARPGHGRYLAEHIRGAHHIERPGGGGLPWIHDVEGTLDEVQAFLTGTRGAPDPDDRVLATVLFTDIVGSTQRAAEVGDKRWRSLLDEHDALTRREIERFRGNLIKSTGDGLLATFDGPARATRCALALAAAVRALGIEVRAGLHTGEIEQRDHDIGGIAVHIAERIMVAPGPGEVLVSGSVPPLVAGSGIEFDDRGMRVLKGVPGEWRIFAVTGPSVHDLP